MSDRSAIEWTEATWNPVTGCTKVSAGCDRCYAETFAERFRGTPGHYYEGGFDVQLRPEKLDQPLRWKRPRRIFVNSMSDLFHDSVPDDYIIDVFAVMALAPRHTFQLLTKRHARMRSLISDVRFRQEMFERLEVLKHPESVQAVWPLPNVWLGVSTENQQWADIRIPALLATPAAVRWISAEPLLGAIVFDPDWLPVSCRDCNCDMGCNPPANWRWLDWVVAGGESGRGARPMHPGWARSLRDQCETAGVPFLFKQWGEWSPIEPDEVTGKPTVFFGVDGKGTYYADRYRDGIATLARIGKRAAARELDGRTWDQYPGAVTV